MLERAASSLELCAAHRILYRPTRHARSCRRLHPAFWQHGTATLELSAAWAALQRARAHTWGESTRRSKPLSTRYDALESLYLSDTSTLPAARRPPFLLDAHDKHLPSPSLPQSRPISTSAPRCLFALRRELATSLPYNAQPSAVGRHEALAPRRYLSTGKPGDNSEPGHNGKPLHKRRPEQKLLLRGSQNPRGNSGPGNNSKPREDSGLGENGKPGENRRPGQNRRPGRDHKLGNNDKSGGNGNGKPLHQNPRKGSHGPRMIRPEQEDSTRELRKELLEMMHPQHGHKYADKVWELYGSLPHIYKYGLRARVLRYLRRVSRGETDIRRCWDLASGTHPHFFRRGLVLDAVWCALKLGMHSRALEYLKLNLDCERVARLHFVAASNPHRGVSNSIFEEILHLAFETASWALLWNACRIWRVSAPDRELPSLDFLDSFPGLEDVIQKLWRHHSGWVGHQRDAAGTDDIQDTKAPGVHNSLPPDGPLSNAAPILQAGVAAEAAPNSDSGQRSPGTTQPAAGVIFTRQAARHDNVTCDAVGIILKAARKALLRPCKPNDAINLLHTIRRPKLYTLYFRKMVRDGTTHHLPELFRECKRRLGRKIDRRTLRVMFDVFYPHNPDGLLEVHQDFCRLHYGDGQGPSGDPALLRAWWVDSAVRGALSSYARDPLAFLPYVEESRRRGDSDTAQFALELLMPKLGFEPDELSWFAELKLYAERLDYEGAMEVWQPRFNSDKPDRVTLFTLLRLASERGDVAFTTGLFDKAKLWRLDREPQVLIPVIRAFGIHRSPREAANICSWAIDHGVRSTEVFNSMLGVYASFNRLLELHRLMVVMAENDIAWDQKTYMHLMKALGRNKHGYEARDLLNKAPELSAGALTLEHFEIAMAGAIKTTNYELVYEIARRMREEGLPMTLGAMSLLVKAAHRWRQCAEEKPVPPDMEVKLMTGKDLVELYRKTTRSDILDARQRGETISDLDENTPVPEAPASGSAPSHPPSSPFLTPESPPALTGPSRDPLVVKRVAFTLAEVGDSESLYELASVYLAARQHKNSERHLPDGILSAFMVVDFKRGDHERVKYLWRILRDRHHFRARQMAAVEASHRTATKVPPKMQYGLDESFRVMEQVLTLESNPQGLLKLIFDLTAAGFMLGQRSWNHAIQSLLTMGMWKEAFKFNEQMLMPNWTGWRHYRRFKNTRRRHTAWEKHDDPPEEAELAEQAHEPDEPAPEDELLPEDDPSLPEEERQYWRDWRLVDEFLRHMYRFRRMRRMQKRRKLTGTSINLAPRILDPGLNQRYLRPNSQTLHQLARVYLEMEESNQWGGSPQEWLSMFCPVSVLAIKTLRFADEVEALGEGAEEWEDEYEGAERLEGAGGEHGGVGELEGLGDGHRRKVEEAEGAENETEGAQLESQRVIKWKERGIPNELRAAITNVLAQAPARKAARREENEEKRKVQRREAAQRREEYLQEQSWEKFEAEAKEKEREEWMRKAGVVDVEETEEEPLTTENFFNDEEGEESGKSGEEEEEVERDPRRRKHKARRGRKK